MTETIVAVYEDGISKSLQKRVLPEHKHVDLAVYRKRMRNC